jgi:hypothetical protein
MRTVLALSGPAAILIMTGWQDSPICSNYRKISYPTPWSHWAIPPKSFPGRIGIKRIESIMAAGKEGMTI